MKKLLLLIVFAVLISGCVGTQTAKVDANHGLTIASFGASPSSVISGETVLFDVDVMNVGGTTASNAQVDLYGVENQWRDENLNLVDSTLTKQLGTLRPPEPARNVPGGERMVQYNLVTPAIPQGVSSPIKIEARVSFDYNTSGFIDIPAVTDSEMRRKNELGQSISAPTVLNSPGPIHMTMDNKFSPILVDDTQGSEDIQNWPLRIVFTNVGDGFPITPEDDETIRGAGGKLTGTIEVLGPGAEFSDCQGVTSGTVINLDSIPDLALRIRQSGHGGSVPMACQISIDKSQWGNRPEDSVKLIFNLFYRYYEFSTATVQVSGR